MLVSLSRLHCTSAPFAVAYVHVPHAQRDPRRGSHQRRQALRAPECPSKAYRIRGEPTNAASHAAGHSKQPYITEVSSLAEPPIASLITHASISLPCKLNCSFFAKLSISLTLIRSPVIFIVFVLVLNRLWSAQWPRSYFDIVTTIVIIRRKIRFCIKDICRR